MHKLFSLETTHIVEHILCMNDHGMIPCKVGICIWVEIQDGNGRSTKNSIFSSTMESLHILPGIFLCGIFHTGVKRKNLARSFTIISPSAV